MSREVVGCYITLMNKNPAHKLVLNSVVELVNGLGVMAQIEWRDINSLRPSQQIEKLRKELWEKHKEIRDLKKKYEDK